MMKPFSVSAECHLKWDAYDSRSRAGNPVMVMSAMIAAPDQESSKI